MTVKELKDILNTLPEEDFISVAFGESDGINIAFVEINKNRLDTHFIIIDKDEVKYWIENT